MSDDFKKIRIDLTAHPEWLAAKKEVGIHDGSGRKHGEEVDVPIEVADFLVGKKMAVYVEGSQLARKAQQEAALDEARAANAKATAMGRMHGHDDMPPELRALAQQEEGNAVRSAYLRSLDEPDGIEEGADVHAEPVIADPAPKRRGRPPKVKPTEESH